MLKSFPPTKSWILFITKAQGSRSRYFRCRKLEEIMFGQLADRHVGETLKLPAAFGVGGIRICIMFSNATSLSLSLSLSLWAWLSRSHCQGYDRVISALSFLHTGLTLHAVAGSGEGGDGGWNFHSPSAPACLSEKRKRGGGLQMQIFKPFRIF